MCWCLMLDYWMEWFVGSAKKDSYSEDFAEDSCANTSYTCVCGMRLRIATICTLVLTQRC